MLGDAELAAMVRRVFLVRGTGASPTHLGVPPVGWAAPFAAWAAELNLTHESARSASAAVDRIWTAAQRAAEREEP